MKASQLGLCFIVGMLGAEPAVPWAISPIFADAGIFSGGRVAGRIPVAGAFDDSGHWGFYDDKGKALLPPKWDDAQEFQNGKAWVNEQGRWGLIDAQGRYVLTPRFDQVGPFRDGMARVRLGNRWGYASHDGKTLLPVKYDDAMDYSGGLARVKEGNLWGFLDLSGRAVYPGTFATAWDFHEGFAAYQIDNRFGFATPNQFVIPPVFDDVGDFHGGLAMAAQYSRNLTGLEKIKWGFVGPRGDFLIPPTFDEVGSFSEGMARCRTDGLWTWIDTKAHMKIPPAFDQVRDFGQGRAAFLKGGKWGLVDETLKVVLRPTYDQMEAFQNGQAVVRVKTRKGLLSQTLAGLIDLQGKEILAPQYEEIVGDGSSFYRYRRGGKWGLLSADGKVFLEAQFSKLDESREGLMRAENKSLYGFLRLPTANTNTPNPEGVGQ